MPAIVTCAQCGAPHAGPDGVTRFECDFCGATIRIDASPSYEELVCPTPFDASRCEDTVARELVARGCDQVEVRTQSPRWIAVWQVTSSEGEEQVHLAQKNGGPFDQRLGLPALPLRDRHALEPEDIDDLPPGAPLDATSAHEAAQSLFDDPTHAASHLRLVWFRIVDLCVLESSSAQWGVYVVGGDRVFLPEVTRVRSLGPAQPALVGRFGIFASTSLVIAASATDPWSRAGLLILLVAIAYAAELLPARWWWSR
jgi:hypothetical protein